MARWYEQVYGRSYYEAIKNLNSAFKEGKCASQPVIDVRGKKIPRPFSFRELILKGLEAFDSGKIPDPSSNFFEVEGGSCSATIPSENGKKFKIIPVCKELITLSDNLDFIEKDYGSIHGIEVDVNACGRYISYDEAIKNRAWLAVLEEDRHLLKACAEFFYKRFDVQRGMLFCHSTKGLRAIVQVGSHAYGDLNLNGPTIFPL